MTDNIKNIAINLFTDEGLSKSEISRKLNVPRTTIRRWLLDIVSDNGVIEEDESPLSETAIPKIQNCTKEEALADLREIAENNPEMCISRNYYRVNGKYSESAWNKFFGSFNEYKRQAGIILTRQQHNMEKHVAKHASVDHYRAMSIERFSYADNYVVENGNTIKKIIVASDMHDKNIDSFYLEVFLDTLKRVRPDVIVLAGDIFDCPEFGKYTVDPRDWDVVGRIKFAHDNILQPIRDICPEAQIDFIEGNHEARMLKHLADTTPALRAVLSDLHGMTVGSLFGLDKFKINYIAKGNLAAYSIAEQHKEVAKNYKIYFDSFLIGHEPHMANLGFPGISGHHHKTEISSHYNAHFGNYQWVQIGGGHKLDSEYSMSKWNHGFCIVTCDTETKESIFDTITFTQNMAIVGGKIYKR